MGRGAVPGVPRRRLLRIDPNDVVVDLGANRGLFTLMALAHGPGVSVVARRVRGMAVQNL